MNAPDICRNRHRRNAESEAANRRVSPKKEYLRTLIVEWFLQQGNAGATCEQASRELGIRYTTMSARISELKADRWLVPVTEANGAHVRRKTSGGSSACVLRAQTKAERDGLVWPKRQAELFEARR